jgi:hypothetical protein
MMWAEMMTADTFISQPQQHARKNIDKVRRKLVMLSSDFAD